MSAIVKLSKSQTLTNGGLTPKTGHSEFEAAIVLFKVFLSAALGPLEARTLINQPG